MKKCMRRHVLTLVHIIEFETYRVFIKNRYKFNVLSFMFYGIYKLPNGTTHQRVTQTVCIRGTKKPRCYQEHTRDMKNLMFVEQFPTGV